jgi:chromosome segregation ATPase
MMGWKEIHKMLVKTQNDMREQLDALLDESRKLREEHELLKAKIEEYESKLREYEQMLERPAESIRRKLLELQEETQKEISRLASLNQQYEKRCKLLELQLEESLTTLKETQEINKELGTQLSSLKDELSDVEKDHKTKIEELTRKLQSSRDRLKRYRELIRKKENELKEYQKGLEVLENIVKKPPPIVTGTEKTRL